MFWVQKRFLEALGGPFRTAFVNVKRCTIEFDPHTTFLHEFRQVIGSFDVVHGRDGPFAVA